MIFINAFKADKYVKRKVLTWAALVKIVNNLTERLIKKSQCHPSKWSYSYIYLDEHAEFVKVINNNTDVIVKNFKTLYSYLVNIEFIMK